MLARKGTLTLRNGDTIELPRLVPSFSSKGFPFYRDRESKRLHSEVSHALELAANVQIESFLVSAYDIHHEHLCDAKRFFSIPKLLFLDSGGYELSPDFDATEPDRWDYKSKPFTPDDYRKVIKLVKTNLPVIITNLDWQTAGKPIDEQILAAQKFFNESPRWLTRNFIIKPTSTKKGELKKTLQT